jgi:hypothetical protein
LTNLPVSGVNARLNTLAGLKCGSSPVSEDLKVKQLTGTLLALMCMATCFGCKPTPEPEVKITPSSVTILDNSKRGTPLATVSVRTAGAQFTGELRLTNNPGGICQLAGAELQLGRDTTNADDYTNSVCTVTAFPPPPS